ncbi:MAG: hypothetical protein GEU82_19230, partial [Luteitalea sp.]|nr:hypothetical protein [Luteitalea sp.]
MLARLLRVPALRCLWTKFPIGSAALRARHDIDPRPHYRFGVWEGAELARALGIPRITVCEFGVAGGRGLLALERIAEETEGATGVGVDVVGFDSGQGLPPPRDYRDVPHFWATGNYKMDEQALRRQLRRAHLV